MESFEGLLAVVTGGGTGMGRELVIQLAAQGCSVAACDVNAETMSDTVARAQAGAPAGVQVTGHTCDVAKESDMNRFRDEVVDQHGADHIELLFNNAGIGGGGAFVNGSREEWERTFGVCWGGVYNGCRAFMPLLVAADQGYVVNTSSVNGFWASLGPGVSHTAYSAAKFAVKGFTEALINDLRANAPHVKCAVVMPGHIGTDIAINTRLVQTGSTDISDDELKAMRAMMTTRGMDHANISDDDLRTFSRMAGESFRDTAPMTAAAAATVILDAVKAGKWRILVGDDAVALDENVRANPEAAYDVDFVGITSITQR